MGVGVGVVLWRSLWCGACPASSLSVGSLPLFSTHTRSGRRSRSFLDMAHPPLPMLLLLLVAVGVLGGVKAGVNPRCGCERTRHARRLEEDAKIPPYGMEDPVASWEVEELPQQFDWSSVAGKSYLVGSWNQHIPKYCGSCFAHGTLMSLNDRIKVAKDGKGPEIMLSRQSFINCGPEFGFSSGCMGGNPTDIFQFMHDIG